MEEYTHPLAATEDAEGMFWGAGVIAPMQLPTPLPQALQARAGSGAAQAPSTGYLKAETNDPYRNTGNHVTAIIVINYIKSLK